MKFLVAFTVCIAAAAAFVIPPNVAGADLDKVQEIVNAINHPSTDPATAAALEQLLYDLLHEITPSPAIIPPVIVEPDTAFEEDIPINPGPAIIDDSIISEPANYQGQTPLVQVIVNVNAKSAGKPVPEKPVDPVIVPEVKPEPIIVAPVIVPEVKPEPIIITPIVPEVIKPEPVIVTPIQPTPVVNLPEILN